jgi:hypothetical protein
MLALVAILTGFRWSGSSIGPRCCGGPVFGVVAVLLVAAASATSDNSAMIQSGQGYPLAKKHLLNGFKGEQDDPHLAPKFLDRRQRAWHAPQTTIELGSVGPVTYAELEDKPVARNPPEAKKLADG